MLRQRLILIYAVLFCSNANIVSVFTNEVLVFSFRLYKKIFRKRFFRQFFCSVHKQFIPVRKHMLIIWWHISGTGTSCVTHLTHDFSTPNRYSSQLPSTGFGSTFLWCQLFWDGRVSSKSRMFGGIPCIVCVMSNCHLKPSQHDVVETRYEHNMMICTYDDDLSRGYNIFLISLAIGSPICATVICYWRLFAYVLCIGFNASINWYPEAISVHHQ